MPPRLLALARLRLPPRRTSTRSGQEQAINACALALVLWPIIAGVPAFIVALLVAAVLARLRPNKEFSSP